MELQSEQELSCQYEPNYKYLKNIFHKTTCFLHEKDAKIPINFDILDRVKLEYNLQFKTHQSWLEI